MSLFQRTSALLCALLLCGVLGACGQKGPLYIPQQETPAADESAPAE